MVTELVASMVRYCWFAVKPMVTLFVVCACVEGWFVGKAEFADLFVLPLPIALVPVRNCCLADNWNWMEWNCSC